MGSLPKGVLDSGIGSMFPGNRGGQRIRGHQ